jgi:hypothetical protein
MTFKQYYTESLDREKDALELTAKELKKKKVEPKVIGVRVLAAKKREMDDDKKNIIARYWRTQGGNFESQL